MCSPVQIIAALPEAAACGFTMPSGMKER